MQFSPEAMALLGAGTAMLDPRGTYGSFGAAANNAMRAGLGTYLPIKQEARRNELESQRSKLLEAQLDSLDRKNQLQGMLLGQFQGGEIPQGDQAGMFGVPQNVMQAMVLGEAAGMPGIGTAAMKQWEHNNPGQQQKPWYVTDDGGIYQSYRDFSMDKARAGAVNFYNGSQFPYPVPEGYMPKDVAQPNLGLEPIPGGPKDEAAKAAQAAQIDLPKVQQEATYTVNLLNDIIEHPGKGYAVGKSAILPIPPGTDAADFMTRYKQIEGQQFMQAYQTLKGGGQITEVEGQKATEAMARLSRTQKEGTFDASVKELQEILLKGLNRARKKAGQPELKLEDLLENGKTGGDLDVKKSNGFKFLGYE